MQPAATELPPPPPADDDEQTGRAAQTQEDCSPAETDQQQQQQLEHAEEQADKLTPLPTAAATGEETATIIDEGSVSADVVEQHDAELMQDQEGEHEQQFNRLDPSRRSFSSPSVNLLQQQPTATSIGRTIFGRLAKATDKQTAAAARSSTHYQVKTEQATSVEKLRRRTALGLIPLVKNNTDSTSSSSSVSTSWRNWLFQQNNPRFSLRCAAQKQVNRSSAATGKSHREHCFFFLEKAAVKKGKQTKSARKSNCVAEVCAPVKLFMSSHKASRLFAAPTNNALGR